VIGDQIRRRTGISADFAIFSVIGLAVPGATVQRWTGNTLRTLRAAECNVGAHRHDVALMGNA
jgi:hypothetical protein